jgi:hypothetical protein
MQLKPFTFSPNGSANTNAKNVLGCVYTTSCSVPKQVPLAYKQITMASSLASNNRRQNDNFRSSEFSPHSKR